MNNKKSKIVKIVLALNMIEESSSSDSDQLVELVNISRKKFIKKRNTIKFYTENIVLNYTTIEFKCHFRLCRGVFHLIVQKFKDSDVYQNLFLNPGSRCNITAEKHILMFLWFAGHQGESFRSVGDRFDLSISSVEDVLKRVTKFLSQLSKTYIKWPSSEEREVISTNFSSILPHVIGCIDGCHIKIDYKGNDYINRKSYSSIIMQGVCNDRKKFIDVFIGFPGATHDARVYSYSKIPEKLLELNSGYLLGDSAYPMSMHLLTPYKDNGRLTDLQKKFNRNLSSIRIKIEHTFGILKQRFRQLYHLKLKNCELICHFIRACCVLHNICNEEDLLLFDAPIIEPAFNDFNLDNIIEVEGSYFRDEVANNMN